MKMKRNHMFMMAGALALAVGVAGTAMAQSSAVAQAMAAGTVGEQADGYLGVKGSVAAAVKAEVDSRSEEHTSELQSLMRISYAVFCLKKKIYINSKPNRQNNTTHHRHNTIKNT